MEKIMEENRGQRRNTRKKQVLKYSKTRNNCTNAQRKEPVAWAGIHFGHKNCIPESVIDQMKIPWWLKDNQSFGVKINPDWKPGGILKGAADVMERAKSGMKYPRDILHPERTKRRIHEAEENYGLKDLPQIQVFGKNRKPGYISKETREVMQRAKAGIRYSGDRLHPERAKRKIPDEYQKLREANEYQSRKKDKNQCPETKLKKVLPDNENNTLKVLQSVPMEPEPENPKENKINRKKTLNTKSKSKSKEEKKHIPLGRGDNAQLAKISKKSQLLPKKKRPDIKTSPKKDKR